MRASRTRLVFGQLMLVACLVGLATPALAQGYPAGPTVTVTPSSVQPCQTTTVTGTGFPPNTSGTVMVAGTSYPITTDASGNFTLTITVPCTSSGALGISVSVGGMSASASVTVLGSGSGQQASGLPVTGSTDGTWLLARIGALLIVAGVAFVSVSTLRRRSARSN